MTPVLSPLGPKMCRKEPLTPLNWSAQTDPASEENHGHRERHVEVGIAAAQQRPRDFKTVFTLHAPANRADAGNQPEPVRRQDENENRREEPERLLHQSRSDDAFEKTVKSLHQPFPEVLRARRHFLNFPGGEPGKHNHAHRHNPRHQHGIGDKTAFMAEGLGALGNGLLCRSSRCLDRCRHSSGQGCRWSGFARCRIQCGGRNANKKGARDYQSE